MFKVGQAAQDIAEARSSSPNTYSGEYYALSMRFLIARGGETAKRTRL